MEWLQTLLDSSTAPALTAFLLGLLTAVSPCPLATSIAAIGFIGKDIETRLGYSSMAYYNARSCNYLYIAGYRIDTNTQRGFKSFRYSEVYRQIRRTRTRPCLVIDRFIHTVRRQTEITLFRF